MKTLALILSGALAILPASGETTTKPKTYRELEVGSRVFKNATITSVTVSDAIIRHDGGIAKVPISDLPVHIRETIPYDADKAAEAEAEAKARTSAAQKQLSEQKLALAQLAAWRGEPRTVTVQSITSRGTIFATIEGEGTKEIKVTAMPNKAGIFFSELKAAEQRLINANDELKRANRVYQDIPPYTYYSTPEELAELERRLQRARNRLRVAEQRVQQAENDHRRLLSEQLLRTSFSARKTASTYGKAEIWEYFGPPVFKQAEAKQPTTQPFPK